jgi:hypothetical protein
MFGFRSASVSASLMIITCTVRGVGVVRGVCQRGWLGRWAVGRAVVACWEAEPRWGGRCWAHAAAKATAASASTRGRQQAALAAPAPVQQPAPRHQPGGTRPAAPTRRHPPRGTRPAHLLPGVCEPAVRRLRLKLEREAVEARVLRLVLQRQRGDALGCGRAQGRRAVRRVGGRLQALAPAPPAPARQPGSGSRAGPRPQRHPRTERRQSKASPRRRRLLTQHVVAELRVDSGNDGHGRHLALAARVRLDARAHEEQLPEPPARDGGVRPQGVGCRRGAGCRVQQRRCGNVARRARARERRRAGGIAAVTCQVAFPAVRGASRAWTHPCPRLRAPPPAPGLAISAAPSAAGPQRHSPPPSRPLGRPPGGRGAGEECRQRSCCRAVSGALVLLYSTYGKSFAITTGVPTVWFYTRAAPGAMLPKRPRAGCCAPARCYGTRGAAGRARPARC